MNKPILYLLFLLLLTTLSFSACSNKPDDDNPAFKAGENQISQQKNAHKEHDHHKQENKKGADDEHNHSAQGHGHEHEEIDEVHLSASKLASLGIKVDALPLRSLSGNIKVNGSLALFPQHRATVTAILGANVTAIEVIEGEKVKKKQVLAYLSHPNLTNLQAAYIRAYNQMQFLEKEYQRDKRLYEANVGSGKAYQQAQADFLAMKGEVTSYEVQLNQLNIDVRKARTGKIIQNVPVVSPIDGNIEKVFIQMGQFVNPNTTLFRIINLEHIHADLMVFEKNVSQVKEGQKVSFRVESVPGKTLSARIFSVGKNFEQSPRAVHVHAEIEQKENFLIPGMYIYGEIHTGNSLVNALPESAIVMEGAKTYIFMAEIHHKSNDKEKEWIFKPIEIITGISDEGWVEIKLLEPLPKSAKVAWNNAYYLIAEMKKSETSHEH